MRWTTGHPIHRLILKEALAFVEVDGVYSLRIWNDYRT